MSTSKPYVAKKGGVTVSKPLAALATPALAPTATDVFLGDGGIEVLEGFEKLPNLRTLHLPNNLVSSLDGLAGCFRLKHLYARNNRIQTLVGLFDFCPHIEELDLSANAISFLDTCIAELSTTRLTHLSLRGNPVSQESGYRARVIAAIPALEVLDDLVVSPDERREAERSVYGTAGSTNAAVRGAKPGSKPASSSGRPAIAATALTSSASASAVTLGSNGSVLARELEREVRVIKDKRRERTRQELEESMQRVVDPVWEAALSATRHLRASAEPGARSSAAVADANAVHGAETRRPSDTSEFGASSSGGVIVPSALMAAIASEAASGGEELVQRGIRAGMMRREVSLPESIPIPDAIRSASLEGGAAGASSAPPSKQEAALLKTALVATFLPRPHTSAATTLSAHAPFGATGAGGTVGRAATPGIRTGGLTGAMTRTAGAGPADAAFGSIASSLVTTASITPTAPAASNAVVATVLAASLKASALAGHAKAGVPAGARPPTGAGSASASALLASLATAGFGASGAFGATSSSSGGAGLPGSPLRSTGHLSLRARRRGDPAQFQRTVEAKVRRLLAVERSGGLSADVTPATGSATMHDTAAAAGSVSRSGAGSSGSAAQLVGWDRFRVVQAIEQYARSLDAANAPAAPSALAPAAAAAAAAGPGSKPSSATARATSGGAAASAAAASARGAGSAGLAGAGAATNGASAGAGAVAGAAVAGPATAGSTRRVGAAGAVRSHLLPAQLRAALQSCMDFGLVPEPEPEPGRASSSGTSSLPASGDASRRPSDSGGQPAASSSAASASASASASARDELSRYVESTALAMGFPPGAPVPWQAFLAAAETGSFTRSSSASATVAAAAAVGGAAGASDASSASSASASGPGIVRVRRLRWRPLSLSEAEERAATHFKRASDALAALRRIPESDPSAEGLRRVVASGTERGNRLLDIAAALAGSYDPPPQPPLPRRPRSDIYAYASLLPATLAGKLREKALVSGGTLGWSHGIPPPGEESDDDEEDAVQLLLRAERHSGRAAGLGGTASVSRRTSAAADADAAASGGSRGVNASAGDRGRADEGEGERQLVGRLKDAMASDVWSRYRRKARLQGPHEIVHTALPLP